MSPSMPSTAPGPPVGRDPIEFVVDGHPVSVDPGGSLLDALREQVGIRSAKDGCSPQGQCGCCTVLIDGQPRVSCVTPVRRVAGREITTVDGLAPSVAEGWAQALCTTGGSQCGFCTPGIVCRLEGQRAKSGAVPQGPALGRALAAHLCRCTGWQTIAEAVELVASAGSPGAVPAADRDLEAAGRRAGLEGRSPQRVGPDVALGRGGFADDTAPSGALVALLGADGDWVVAETLAAARAQVGKVQGRRSTIDVGYPIDVPAGGWAATLQTTWVEPAYLELDAAWCEPGGEPAGPLANGGAFGGKVSSPVGAAARRLADEHGRAVRVLWTREDSVRLGPKRPPIGAGIQPDGTGVVRVARTPGVAAAITAFAPGLVVEEIDVPGPPTSASARAAGWAEAAALLSAVAGAPIPVRSPDGAEAEASVGPDGITVRVSCGAPLDETVVRSYCIGAAHMAYSWVTSEALRVDAEGAVHDLTVRSFGVLRAADTPHITVEIEPGDGPPINGSDAVFASVAAATWLEQGTPPTWPTRIGAGR